MLARLLLVFALLGVPAAAHAADWAPCDRSGARSGIVSTLRALFGADSRNNSLDHGRACYSFTDTTDPDSLLQVEAARANVCLYPDIDATDTGTATVDIDRALYPESSDAGEFEEIISLDGVESTDTFCFRVPRGSYRARVEACSSCNGVLAVTVDE